MFSRSPIIASAETLQAILNALPVPVFLSDRAHRLVLVNDAMCQLAGRPRDEILDHTPDHLPDEQTAVFHRVDDEVFATGEPRENEEVVTDGTGALRIHLTRKCLIHLPTAVGTQPFVLGVISNITAIREAERRAQYLAQHDPLTGLANRTQLNDRLAAAIDMARRSDDKVALLLLDLDGFKAVNDRHGHPAGDELLRVVAKRLVGLVRSVDTVARFGGDEFCIVQAAVRQPSGTYGLAERIISSLSRPVALGAVQLPVSASVGIALFPDDAGDPELLLQRADAALYTVKRSGRQSYFRYDHPASPHPKKWDIEAELAAALEADRLSLAFQPMAAAADGTVRGFEALLRWEHSSRGSITPELFIPAAESAGMIQQLGAWVLHKACAAAAAWPEPLQIAVNVSPSQMESGELPAAVEQALAASGLPATRLELEITEAALLGSPETLSATFARLKTLGVSIALDDFGAGWSSLAALRHYPFDRIKIDRSFVGNMETDTRSATIVRAVLSLAQALKVPVTAEGVEAQAQLNTLRQMGCAELQGFYVGRPGPEAVVPDTKRLWPPFKS